MNLDLIRDSVGSLRNKDYNYGRYYYSYNKKGNNYYCDNNGYYYDYYYDGRHNSCY